MSLKAELQTWAAALERYDAQEYEAAIKIFTSIADSAKVLFNIGLINATIGAHPSAIEAFHQANSLDHYLAVSYFQCGVSNFLINRFEEAYCDFNEAYQYLRGNYIIDYEQLGLNFHLYSCEVLFNRGLALIYMGNPQRGMADLHEAQNEKQKQEHNVIDEAISDRGDGYTVFSIPVGVIYRPPESKLKNVQSKNYLGQAKLVAATNKSDTSTEFYDSYNSSNNSSRENIVVSSHGPKKINALNSNNNNNSNININNSNNHIDLSRARTAAARVPDNDHFGDKDSSSTSKSNPNTNTNNKSLWSLRRRPTEVTTAISIVDSKPSLSASAPPSRQPPPTPGGNSSNSNSTSHSPVPPPTNTNTNTTSTTNQQPLSSSSNKSRPFNFLTRSATTAGYLQPKQQRQQQQQKQDQEPQQQNSTIDADLYAKSPAGTINSFYDKYRSDDSNNSTATNNSSSTNFQQPALSSSSSSSTSSHFRSKSSAAALPPSPTPNTYSSRQQQQQNQRPPHHQHNFSDGHVVFAGSGLRRKKTIDHLPSQSSQSPFILASASRSTPRLGRSATMRNPATTTITTNNISNKNHHIKFDEEDGYGSAEYDDVLSPAQSSAESNSLTMDLIRIRVKLHCDDQTRGMSIMSTMEWPEFHKKVLAKFNFIKANLTYKDEDGTMITMLDESDWESAIDASREFANGRPDGKLEVWVNGS